MRRTQIYLPYDVHEKLSKEAKRKQLTMSELIRRRISDNNDRDAQIKKRREAFQELERIGRSLDWSKSPKNLSELIDETLYQ